MESFAKKRLYTFPGVPQEAGLWENISLCSAVMEGAWYLFYDNKKKPSKSNTVKKFIRESIDSFHSTLVTESKICLSLAVFGNQGVGKSFFLNFLLNWGLPADQQVENGPLPSAEGGSQTPLPIYVKYGKRVKVLFHKQRKSDSPEIWFPEANLDKKSLEDVRNLLQIKFQELDQQGKSHDSNVKDETRVELQGPFPVFHGLKNREMTSSGQLELEVDVEFVDVPGYGAETGNDSISVELSKADVVLFFDSQLSGRPVSAEDIAAIFRKHDEFEFTRRPKLVHVVNDRKVPTSTSSCNIDLLLQQKKENLSKAWALFLQSSSYEDERGKVPQLSGEAVLEKLQDESEVVYFNPAADQCSILKSLKQVINQHVQHVMIKQAVHPFLQKVHLAATRLKTRICRIKTTEKRNNKAIEIKEEVSFQIKPDENEESELVASCITQTDLPLHYEDIGHLFGFLYEHFIYSNETLDFLLNLLRRTLETFTNRLMYTLRNSSWSTFKEAPSDLIEVAEILCESRVQQFCATSALAYLIDVLNKGKDRNPFTKKKQEAWSKANDEERKNLCRDFIYILLERTYESLEKETGERQRRRKSHFTLCQLLKQDVKDLLAVQSLNDDADRRALLELLVKKLQEVIQFCHQTIYEINPHPSLNIRKSISLPTKMVDKDETSTVPIDSSHEKIVKEVKHLLLKPVRKAATDAIRKLETKLNCGKGGLELPRPHKVENLLWARVLINVLCDKDHFDIQLEDGFLLDQRDAEVGQLLVLARKRLLAYQKSCVTCRIMKQPSPSDDVIRLRKSDHDRYCLEVLISPKVSQKLDEILANFKDPSQSLAPIFIPSVRPGPTPEILGNYFLEEDPWSKGQRMNDGLKENDKEVLGEEMREVNSSSVLNIFLVVEQHHLETFKATIDGMQQPPANNVNLLYVVLPQRGRGIGVTMAIIKSLAECFRFSLYWTIDDDIQFMYQFDGNSRRWYKCSITGGLQFGQRVFQTCLGKAVKALNEDQRDDLFEDATKDWEPWAKQIKRSANKLLVDDGSFSRLQRDPNLLHSPFAEAAKACGGDPDKEKKLMDYERQFVAECRKRIFDDTVNHIAGVSLAHESSKRYDYMSKYPKADYMCSEQRYQVVLHNAPALKGRNYVADEVIFSDEELQVVDKSKRDSPYWGIKGSAKSFIHTLKLSGVIGYQVIRVVHSHKKLADAFNRAQTKKDEDENENDDINMEADY